MSTLTVTLPGLPPSTNKLYTRTRGGGQRLSDAATAWKETVWFAVIQEAARVGFALPPKTPWVLTVTAYVPRWNRDLDNLLKLTIDGICVGLDCDDRYLACLLALRYPGGPAMRLEIGVV